MEIYESVLDQRALPALFVHSFQEFIQSSRMETKGEKNRNKHRILVVDDHPLFREGLVRVLNRESDLEVCGETATAEVALKQIGVLNPDLVIVDISLEGMNGIDLTK